MSRESIPQVVDRLIDVSTKTTTGGKKGHRGELDEEMNKIKEIIERISKGEPSTKTRSSKRLLANLNTLKDNIENFKNEIGKENKKRIKLNKKPNESSRVGRREELQGNGRMFHEGKSEVRRRKIESKLSLRLTSFQKEKSVNVLDSEYKTKSRQGVEQTRRNFLPKSVKFTSDALETSATEKSITKGEIIAQVIEQIQRATSNSTSNQNVQIGGVSLNLENLKMFEFKDLKRINISLTVEGERIQIAASQDKGGINVQVQTNSKETEARLEHTMRDIRSEFRERGLDVQTELNSREKREEKEGEGQKEQGNFRQEEDEHASEREEENDGFDRKH